MGGVVQYDKGKPEDGGRFVLKGQINRPPDLFLNAVAAIVASHDMTDSLISTYLKQAQEKCHKILETGYALLADPDTLYCGECDRDVEGLVG